MSSDGKEVNLESVTISKVKVDYNQPLLVNIAMDEKEKAIQRLYMSFITPSLTLRTDELKKNLESNPALIDQLIAAGRYCYSSNDRILAITYFEKAKELNSGYACFCLGYIYQHDIPPDAKRAIENYQNAIRMKEPKAWVNLGVIHYQSKDKKQEAREYFRKASEEHVPEGCYNYALQEDVQDSIRRKLFQEAADHGISRAYIWLGKLAVNDQLAMNDQKEGIEKLGFESFGKMTKNDLNGTENYINAALQGEPEGIKRLFTEICRSCIDYKTLGHSEGALAVLEVLGKQNPADLLEIAQNPLYQRRYRRDQSTDKYDMMPNLKISKLYYYIKAADIMNDPEACYLASQELLRFAHTLPYQWNEEQIRLEEVKFRNEAVKYLRKGAILGNFNALNFLWLNKDELAQKEDPSIIVLCLLNNFEKENFTLTDDAINWLKKLKIIDIIRALSPEQILLFGSCLNNLLKTYIRPAKGLLTKFKDLIATTKSEERTNIELQQLNMMAFECLRTLAFSNNIEIRKQAMETMLLQYLPDGKLRNVPGDKTPAVFFLLGKEGGKQHDSQLTRLFSAKNPENFIQLFDEFNSWFTKAKKEAEKDSVNRDISDNKESVSIAALPSSSLFTDEKQVDTDTHEKYLQKLRVGFNQVKTNSSLEIQNDSQVKALENLLNPSFDIEINDAYISNIVTQLSSFKFGQDVLNEVEKKSAPKSSLI